jgi:hypothetical protein
MLIPLGIAVILGWMRLDWPGPSLGVGCSFVLFGVKLAYDAVSDVRAAGEAD